MAGPAAFVVGGEYAPEYRWPWMVGIYYLGVFRCGGVLIDSQFVLSAAHCFVWKNGNSLVNLPHYFDIELGSIQRNSPTALKTKISHITMHHNYTVGEGGFRFNDVALLHLIEPVEMNDRHRPVCLDDDEAAAEVVTSPSTLCYTSGWGYTNRDNRK